MTARIVALEALGFAMVVLLLWLDEVLDLPYVILGAPRTPVNWAEGILESVLVLLLGAAVIWRIRGHLKRIRTLEGLLAICCHCKRIRADYEWVRVEQYVAEHSAAEFTHSICPECLDQHYRPAAQVPRTSPRQA